MTSIQEKDKKSASKKGTLMLSEEELGDLYLDVEQEEMNSGSIHTTEKSKNNDSKSKRGSIKRKPRESSSEVIESSLSSNNGTSSVIKKRVKSESKNKKRKAPQSRRKKVHQNERIYLPQVTSINFNVVEDDSNFFTEIYDSTFGLLIDFLYEIEELFQFLHDVLFGTFFKVQNENISHINYWMMKGSFNSSDGNNLERNFMEAIKDFCNQVGTNYDVFQRYRDLFLRIVLRLEKNRQVIYLAHNNVGDLKGDTKYIVKMLLERFISVFYYVFDKADELTNKDSLRFFLIVFKLWDNRNLSNFVVNEIYPDISIQEEFKRSFVSRASDIKSPVYINKKVDAIEILRKSVDNALNEAGVKE